MLFYFGLFFYILLDYQHYINTKQMLLKQSHNLKNYSDKWDKESEKLNKYSNQYSEKERLKRLDKLEKEIEKKKAERRKNLKTENNKNKKFYVIRCVIILSYLFFIKLTKSSFYMIMNIYRENPEFFKFDKYHNLTDIISEFDNYYYSKTYQTFLRMIRFDQIFYSYSFYLILGVIIYYFINVWNKSSNTFIIYDIFRALIFLTIILIVTS